MYTLSEKTRKLLEQQTKTSYAKLTEMTLDEELTYVKGITGKKVVFSKKRKENVFGRGSPLISRRLLRTMDDVDKGLETFWR